jgi:hypothetical protein
MIIRISNHVWSHEENSGKRPIEDRIHEEWRELRELREGKPDFQRE